jgi:hypothetical protein
VTRAPSENVRRAAGAMADLARNGCVSVDHRDELLVASGVPRGSWDRVVKQLERLGVVAVQRTSPGEARPSSFVVDVARARDLSAVLPAGPPPKRRPNRAKRPAPSRGEGRVYFALAGEHLKIGWSEDPETRVYRLQGANGDEVSLLGTVPGSRDDESALHGRFAGHKARGEWFYAPRGGELLRAVREILTRGTPGEAVSQGEPDRAGPEPVPSQPEPVNPDSSKPRALRDKHNNNGSLSTMSGPRESGVGEPGERSDPAREARSAGVVPVQVNLPWDPQEAIELLETLLAGYRSRVADGGATVVRVLPPAPVERPPAPAHAAASALADLEVPPPEACPVHGERVVAPPRKSDGALFWGCKGWRSDHHCGTQTVSVEAHAAAHRAAAITATRAASKQERQDTEREERMRGRERPKDLSTLEPLHLKGLMKARKGRDPRLDPHMGDEVCSGTVTRRVRARTKARVVWDVVDMDGETHSAAVDQWVRWAHEGSVVRLGPSPVVHDVASLVESVRSVDMSRSTDVSVKVDTTAT